MTHRLGSPSSRPSATAPARDRATRKTVPSQVTTDPKPGLAAVPRHRRRRCSPCRPPSPPRPVPPAACSEHLGRDPLDIGDHADGDRQAQQVAQPKLRATCRLLCWYASASTMRSLVHEVAERRGAARHRADAPTGDGVAVRQGNLGSDTRGPPARWDGNAAT